MDEFVLSEGFTKYGEYAKELEFSYDRSIFDCLHEDTMDHDDPNFGLKLSVLRIF